MAACQDKNHRGPLVAAFEVTYRTPSGATFTENRCRSCVSTFSDGLAAQGGKVIAARGLAEPPSTVQPAPVGLDALVVR